MRIKQVFSAYDWDGGTRPGEHTFCPMCAARLLSEEVGGRIRPVCPDCGYIQYRNPAPGVVVVILRDNRVLLGRRRSVHGNGKWCLPQGFMEFDEDFLTAGIREVKEETGLDVRILSILNVVSNKLSPGLHTLAVILHAEVVGGELSGGDDLEKPGWFDLSEALPEMAFDSDRQVIERFRDAQFDQVLPVDPDHA